MIDVLHLAWQYVRYHRIKTIVLVLAVALIVFIPSGLRLLVARSEQQLGARARATPLLVGAPGSPLELALSSLYFASDVPETVPAGASAALAATGLARAIPLHVRFRAQETPIVGTSLDYFDFRDLRVERGAPMVRLGDCVVGAAAARRRGLAPGDHVVSSSRALFDLAGVYPLRMRVTGILAPADTPDDEAIFVDVKTAWVIEGLAHGHQDLARPEAADGVLRREGADVIANASVVQYNEITDENVDSFHFHGDEGTFPLTAVIVDPRDERAAAILRGRYASAGQSVQMIVPREEIDALLATIFTVQNLVIAALVIVAVATAAVATLVFVLSVRLRWREIETMVKMGASRRRIGAIIAAEITTVIVAGVGLAAVLVGLTAWQGVSIIRAVVIG